DSNVPQPPVATEQEIKDAMEARGDWFVPVLISDLRQAADKAGKPSVVVDAVFHSCLKERCGIDSEFKMFLIQLAFQHIEQQFDCLLSPSIATPNIVSKGKLDPRTVNIPLSLYGLNEKPETVTLASEETPNWTCGIKDGGSTLVVTLSVPRLVRLLFPLGSQM
ncbi:PIH1 family, partial [Thelephora terrestris]